MQQLEGFQYSTELHLNMGFYTIENLPQSHDLTTIVTKFGKFRYNRVPMGLCASGDIFQAKLDEILGDIEGSSHILTIYWYLVKGIPPNI